MTKNKLDPKYKKVWGIYKIINLKNNKIYFGSSNNLYKRSADHFSALRRGKHENKHLQSEFDKYGEDSFTIEVEKTFSKNEITLKNLRDIETEYIQQNRTYLQDYGYNLTSVGSGTSTNDFTEERKRKISKSNKGRIAYNKGINMSKEQRLLLKNINTKRFGKPVLEYDIFGNFIKRYKSITEAAEEHHSIKRDIIDVCKGRRGHYHDKIFRYEGSLDFGEDYFIKKYKRNLSYEAPFYYELVNLDTNEVFKIKGKQNLEIFLRVPNKDKKLSKLVKLLYEKIYKEIIFKNYSIKFIYALSNRDITKELRQPDNNSGVS